MHRLRAQYGTRNRSDPEFRTLPSCSAPAATFEIVTEYGAEVTVSTGVARAPLFET